MMSERLAVLVVPVLLVVVVVLVVLTALVWQYVPNLVEDIANANEIGLCRSSYSRQHRNHRT